MGRAGDAVRSAFGHGATRGPALEISIAPLRAYVFEAMRRGRLFLAGDAAHIVPPTGAKGLNLAVSDVIYLAEALVAHVARGDESGLAKYEAKSLARIWKAERFSWMLTKLMHRFPEDGPFQHRMQLAELGYLAQSTAMQSANRGELRRVAALSVSISSAIQPVTHLTP